MKDKPMGRKNYGSIPHLPGSRVGPGDHKCHEGQSRIATIKPRDKWDEIIVTEKLDGSNTGVFKDSNGIVYPLTRSGYHANTSPYEMHHKFASWVMQNWMLFSDLLLPGERIVGEWLLQAHGTRYALPHVPFVVFDLMREDKRTSYDELLGRVNNILPVPHLIHRGYSLSIDNALSMAGIYGYHGALDPIEGCVWRIQRKGTVDFLAKYVRPDKVDGLYLPELSGSNSVMNSCYQTVST